MTTRFKTGGQTLSTSQVSDVSGVDLPDAIFSHWGGKVAKMSHKLLIEGMGKAWRMATAYHLTIMSSPWTL